MTATPVRVDYQVILAKLQKKIGDQAGELAMALATVDALSERNAVLEERLASYENDVADTDEPAEVKEAAPDDDYPAEPQPEG